VWIRNQLLATLARLAAGRHLEPAARDPACETACRGSHRLLTRGHRLLFSSGRWGGRNTGKNPTDRARPRSKHHVAIDANGTPIAVILTGANRNDITQLLPLVEAIPPVRGVRGRPFRKPGRVYADRAYDHDKYRRPLHAAGIPTSIARRGKPHGSGLGKVRCVVERTHAWLHGFRRLRTRFERRADIHEGLLKLACCLNCWRTLQRSDESF
jgi:transposase